MTKDKIDTYISSRKFGLAWAFSFAIIFFIIGLAAMIFGIGHDLIEVCSQFYIGYAPTLIGSIKGAAWGFVEGLVLGTLIAVIYNKL